MISMSLIRMRVILTHVTRCDLQNDEKLGKYDSQKGGLNMKAEQTKDDNILEIRSMILSSD